MAITVVNLSDPVGSLVTKTNIISGDLGDVALLTSGDSNAVDAINRLIARPATDSAQVVIIARASLSSASPITYDSSTGQIGIGLSVDNTNGGAITLSYDSSSGSIGISNSLKSSATINYDSAAANFSLASNIPVTTFTNIGTLNILDSDGTTLHTLYKAT